MIVNAYSTLREPIEIDFSHTDLLTRDREDPDLVPHLGEMMGVACNRGERVMTHGLYALMRHLERTRHHFRFEIDPDDRDSLAVWGWKSNSILMFPDRSFRDPAGRILVHYETGEAEGNATIPYPIDAIDRMAESRQELSAMHITTSPDVPPVVGEGEVTMRDEEMVGWRTLSLFIAAVRAESLASGKPITKEQLKAKSPTGIRGVHASRKVVRRDGSAISPIGDQFCLAV